MLKYAAMNVVLFFQSTTQKSWREKLAGVYRAARDHDWLVQVIDRTSSPSDVLAALRNWNPIGCLVDRAMASGSAPDRIFGKLPVVYLDQNPKHPSRRHPCVLHDSAATAHMAATELLALDLPSYGFIHPAKVHFWSAEREAVFRTEVKKAGKRYVGCHAGDETLQDWLVSLPKPCGLLLAHDLVAHLVFHAAHAAGISIPRDLPIVSIDNDEIICESLKPGLTSVLPDFEGAGYRLGSLLARMIDASRKERTSTRQHGEIMPTERPLVASEHYGPLRLIRRGSSRRIANSDPRIMRALEFIRQNALDRTITIDEIITVMNCSRRHATTLFKECTGHSIVDEILNLRLEHACELLQRTDIPVSDIIARCGYASESFFKKHFAIRTGMSMRAWRKSHS